MTGGILIGFMDRMPKPRREGYALYSIPDLMSLEEDPNLWIVPDMIPKAGRVLVYGKGGNYKSSIVFDLCVAVASGGRLLERLSVVKAFGPVVLLSTEGSIYTNRDRLMRYIRSRNALPETVKLFYGQQPLELKNPAQMNTLRGIVECVAAKGPAPLMLVLDPMVSFYGGNENDTEQMSRFVNQLNKLIDDFELTVVLIHHANKIGEMRGSTVLQGWADAIIKFDVKKDSDIPGFPQKKDIITVTGEKQREGQAGELFSCVPFFDKKLQMVTYGIYTASDAKGVVVAHLRNEILKMLQSTKGCFTRNELTSAYHVGWQRVQDALEWLDNQGLIEAVGVERSTGMGRSAERRGWRAVGYGTHVDAARAILRASLEHGADAEY